MKTSPNKLEVCYQDKKGYFTRVVCNELDRDLPGQNHTLHEVMTEGDVVALKKVYRKNGIATYETIARFPTAALSWVRILSNSQT